MAETESVCVDKPKSLCKYCKKNTISGLTCLKCDSVYHKACAIRSKTCCEVTIKEKYLPDAKTTDDLLVTEDYSLLRQIIADKCTIIEDKETLITLLNEKISFLEEKLQNYENNTKSIPNKQGTGPAKTFESTEKAVCSKKETEQKTKNTTKPTKNSVSKPSPKNEFVKLPALECLNSHNIQGGPLLESKQMASEILTVQTVQKCDEIINLGSDFRSGAGATSYQLVSSLNGNDNSNWQTVQRKTSFKRKLGQSEDDGKFKGAKPRVWMYIYRVDEEVTEEDIKSFLKVKTDDKKEPFLVKYLKIENNLKSFMVAADYKFKENFYTPSFWPKGVGYRRFNFKKDDIIGNDNQPNSFLGTHRLQQVPT